MKTQILNFFNRLNPFAKEVEQPKQKIKIKIPCDFIACNDCVYYDLINERCGIRPEQIDDLTARFNESDIKRFIKR